MSEYSHVRAYLDPLGLVRTEHGSEWEIELWCSATIPTATRPVSQTRSAAWMHRAPTSRRRAAGARPRRPAPRQPGEGETMTVAPPTPPPLSDELDRLLRRLRLPYVRRSAPEVLATANSQRWEHAEVLRVLLAEAAAGRDRATVAIRRRASGLPAGKTFDAWEPTKSAIPKATQQALRTLEWVDRAEVQTGSSPTSSIRMRSARISLPIALVIESSARWRRSSAVSVSSVCQATLLPLSIARWPSASM